RRYCVWTDARANSSDGRLPLLSDHERQGLIEGSMQRPPAVGSNKASAKRSDRRSRNQRAAVADKQEARITRNDANGEPSRHGLSWSAEEDNRLRTAFEAGEAISAIAAAHERKIGAVRARLVRFGLISEDGVVTS